MYLGIEIGGSKLQIVAGDQTGRIMRRWRASADRAGGGGAIAAQIASGVSEVRSEIDATAIGVGFGGPVDRAAGRIRRSHQIGGWEDFALRDWLQTRSGLPVTLENDSNCAALAEAVLGAAAGESPVFYFNLGSGVGGGIVIDGKIYHGLTPGEAEFGHLRLDRSGSTVESRCSGWAVDRKVEAMALQHPDSFLARRDPGASGGHAARLPAALEQDDPHARKIVCELAEDLTFALSHVVHLLHPAVIVMGGGLALLGEPLRGAIASALPNYLMEAFNPPPPLRLAKLGEDAVPIGALLLAAMACTGHPNRVPS